MLDQQKMIQNIPRDRVDETEVWTSLRFVVTSSRPIKAMLNVVKIDNLTLQNLSEGREIEFNVTKYDSSIFRLMSNFELCFCEPG